MKKSPLSRMNGNQGNRGYQHSPYGNRHRNNSRNSNNYQVSDSQEGRNSQANSGSDFIPFQSSSPVSHRNNSGGWQGCYSGGYRNPRNSFNSSSGSNQSSPYSPFRHSPRQNYGKKNFHNSSQRKVDITAYLDFDSIFENPWAALEGKLNSERSQNGNKTFENDSLEDSKMGSYLSSVSIPGSLTDDNINVSELSQEIKSSPEDS